MAKSVAKNKLTGVNADVQGPEAPVNDLRVSITSRIAGFRRAGIAHPTGPVIYPAGFFSVEQIELLQSEPNLIVVVEGADAFADAATLAAETGVPLDLSASVTAGSTE
jgi:Mu-like prophage FluMu N-terminal domain